MNSSRTIWVALLLFALLLAAIGAGSVAAKAQQTTRPDPILTRDQAVKDARKLVELLELSHPDPYTNMGGKIAFRRKARDLVAAIPADGLKVSELGNRLNAFLAGLRDGHTRVASQKWWDPAWWLLVQFGIAADGLFVTASDIPQLKGTRGHRLVAVNGLSLEKLRELMARELAKENLYGEYDAVANVVRSEKFIHNLLPDSGASVVYTLRSAAGDTSSRTIPWSEKKAKWDPDTASEKAVRWNLIDETPDPFFYRFLDDYKAAYFRIRTIMGREAYEDAWRNNWGDARQDVEAFYKRQKKPVPADMEEALAGIPSFLQAGEELLREMKRRQTPNLVIDLRENGGGVTPSVFPFLYEMYGDRFYGRPSKVEWVTVESQLYLDKYHATAEERRKRTNNPEFQPGDYCWPEDESGDARTRRERAIAGYTEKKFSFAARLAALDGSPIYTPKKVVVLCDPGTFSAAFHFMFYLHELGARVVGVPSSQSPNAFMEETPFTLPESGLRGSISNSMQIFLPEDPHATVFHPDFEMNYALFAKYDFDTYAPLRYALDLLAQGRI